MLINILKNKIVIISVLFLISIFLLLYIIQLNNISNDTSNPKDDNNYVINDNISGEEYNTRETGGDKTDDYVFLGINNLSKAGLYLSDITYIKNVLSYFVEDDLKIEKDRVLKISKDNFTLDTNSNSGYTILKFRLYTSDNEFYIISYQKSISKNADEPIVITVFNNSNEELKKYNL